MSDEQFENYQQRNQSISEEKIENVQSGKRYTRKVQKKSGKQGNTEKNVIGGENKNRRNARKKISEPHPQDEQDEQKQGSPWPARQHMVEGDTEEEQEGERDDRSWLTQRHNSERYDQDEQDEQEQGSPWLARQHMVEGDTEGEQEDEQDDHSWLTQRYNSEGYDQNVQDEQEQGSPWLARQHMVEGDTEGEQESEQSDRSWLTQRHNPEGYAQGEQEEAQEDRSWLTQRPSSEEHIQEEQEGEREDRSWLTQKHIVEGYIEDLQDGKATEKRSRIKKNRVGEYAKSQQGKGDIEGQPEEEQSETPHSARSVYYQLSPHFNFIHQIRKQYQKVTAAVHEQSQQAARPSFMQQLYDQYQRFIAIINGQSQQVAGSDFRQQLHNQYKEIVAAACFLSILPFPSNAQNFFSSDEGEVEPQVVIGSAYFPFVGLFIAVVACILPFIIGPNLHLPSLVLAALVTVALIWLTGGLHLDGLMDACDGLFGGSSRERKLEIMHDSHVGAFGVLGGVSVLLLKFAIFASLMPNKLAIALLMVLPIARWAIVLAMYLFFSARSTGLGATARKTVTLPRLLIAGLISLLIALIVGHLIGLALWMVGTLVTIIVGTWTVYVLGGLTGDVYGAIVEVTEVVCFLMLVVMR